MICVKGLIETKVGVATIAKPCVATREVVKTVAGEQSGFDTRMRATGPIYQYRVCDT